MSAPLEAPPRIVTAAWSVAGVRPGEQRRVLSGAALFFFFIAAVVMAKSASNALFLAHHPPHALPLLYVATSACVGLVSALATVLVADVRQPGAVRTVPAVAAATLAILWVLLGPMDAHLESVFYVCVEVFTTVLNIQLWSLAGAIFDPREGKRLFGTLSAAGMAGSVAGGLFVQEAAGPLRAPTLILCAAVAMAVAAVLAARLGVHMRSAARRRVTSGASTSSGPHDAARDFGTATLEALRYWLVRGLVLYVALAALLTGVVDFAFRTGAAQRLDGSEEALASLFGALNLHVGLVAGSFQLFLSGRLLGRLGIFRYLGLVASAIVLAAGAFLSGGGFAALYALKVAENAMSMSIAHPALQLLYGALPDRVHAAGRGLVDGFVKKAGFALAGVLLLPIAADASTHALVALCACVAGLQGLAIWGLRRPYADALNDRLRIDRAEATPRTHLPVSDHATRTMLRRAVESSTDGARALTAFDLLARDGSTELGSLAERLLTHPDPAAREGGAERAGGLRAPYLAGRLAQLVAADPVPAVRVAAAHGLLRLDRAVGTRALRAFAADPEPGVRFAALEAMLREDPSGPAADALEEALEASDASPGAGLGTAALSERRAVAELLGRLGDLDSARERFGPRLVYLFADPEPAVRAAACRAAGALRLDAFVEPLFRRLTDRGCRHEAREALAAYRDRVVPQVEQWLNDYHRPLDVRLKLPRLLRIIGTQRAAHAMLFSNIHDDASLRYRIVIALSRLHKRHPDVEFDRERTLAAVERRRAAFEHYRDVLDDLEAPDVPECLALLRRAVHDRVEQNFESIFRLLGLVHPQEMLFHVHHRLVGSTDERDRADAAELLETILDDEVRAEVVTAAERYHRARATGLGWAARLSELATSRDLLLRAIARDAAHRVPLNLSGQPPGDTLQTESVSMMTPELLTRVFALENVEIFAGNRVDDLVSIAAIAHERDVRAGEVIFREGDPGEELYIILSGEVDITKAGAHILRLHADDSLGETSLLDQKPHAATATARTDCRLLTLDRTAFLDLVSDRIELVQGIFGVLTRRLRDVLDRAAEDAKAGGPAGPQPPRRRRSRDEPPPGAVSGGD